MARKNAHFKTALKQLHVLHPARPKGGEVFPYHSERSNARATHIQQSSSTTSVTGLGIVFNRKTAPAKRVRSATASVLPTKQYAGMYLHETSGLYLTKYRAFDPYAGRWLGRDPIGEEGGIDLYAYIENYPVDLIDPLGLIAPDPCWTELREFESAYWGRRVADKNVQEAEQAARNAVQAFGSKPRILLILALRDIRDELTKAYDARNTAYFRMNFTQALDILRNGNGIDPNEKEAVEFIISEICRGEGGDLRLTLATLGGELINSRNPSFSHQILQSILASTDDKIETDTVLQSLFIKKTLGSKSVKEGVYKCMIVLGLCTKVVGD